MGRYFVAVYPPPAVVEAVARLPRDPEAAVRWTPEGQWHVTVLFVADADGDHLATALAGARGRRAVVDLGPEVTVLGRGAVVLPAAGLEGLAAEVGTVLAPLVGNGRDRAFRGHLTIGRVRRGAPEPALVGHPFVARFDVTEMVLVHSALGPEGATHRPVARYPLSD